MVALIFFFLQINFFGTKVINGNLKLYIVISFKCFKTSKTIQVCICAS